MTSRRSATTVPLRDYPRPLPVQAARALARDPVAADKVGEVIFVVAERPRVGRAGVRAGS